MVPRLPPNSPVVIRLRWDNTVDLDLQVRAPDGTLLSPKHPTTAAPGVPDGGTAPGYGRLDGDSLAGCVDDGLRKENVVFDAPPISGKYLINVNPFDLCGQIGANYDVAILRTGNVVEEFIGRISLISRIGRGGRGRIPRPAGGTFNHSAWQAAEHGSHGRPGPRQEPEGDRARPGARHLGTVVVKDRMGTRHGLSIRTPRLPTIDPQWAGTRAERCTSDALAARWSRSSFQPMTYRKAIERR